MTATIEQTRTARDTSELVLAAGRGDESAWRELVEAYGGLVLAIARSYRLSPGDSADVSQTTWLRLCENIDRIYDPSRIAGWLAMTARRECLRVIGRSRRLVLVAETGSLSDAWALADEGVDAQLLAAEREVHVQHALELLPDRSRTLLRLLMLDPPPAYQQVAAALDMPVGSIGPTRGRALRKLQGTLALTGIVEPARAASRLVPAQRT